VTTTVQNSADLVVTQTAPASLPAGSYVTYNITVTNNGPQPAQNVTLSDSLPSGLTLLTQSQLSGPAFTLNQSSSAVNETLGSRASGTIAPGAAANGPYRVTVTAGDGTSSASTTFNWNVNSPITLKLPPEAHHNLGVALAQHSQPEQAVETLRRVLQLQPAYPEAHSNLGAVLGTLKRWEEAIASYRKAIRLRPDYGEPYNNLGLALVEVRRPEEAIVYLRQAVRLRPQAPEGHNNLGLALAELGRFAESESCSEEALWLNPKYAEAHTNLANTYKEQGRFTEALASYQLALWFDPSSASARYNRSLALLQMGDYQQGWPEYEWRWRRPSSN
jgi:uncharacterized repeat protein (TIGR01451 family)